MENIKELIFEEFSEAGYSEIEKTERLPIWANESKSDFWMVFDDLNLDEDEQKDLYDEYRHITEAYQAAEKNISVLILKKVHQIEEVERQWAVETENDKLFFKKYVLLYTEEAYTKLRNQVLVDKEKHLSDYLSDGNVFKKLMSDEADGAYTLLYGIAHKLPFLLVQMEKSQLKLSYPNLEDSPVLMDTDAWINEFPDDEDEIEKQLSGILKSIKL